MECRRRHMPEKSYISFVPPGLVLKLKLLCKAGIFNNQSQFNSRGLQHQPFQLPFHSNPYVEKEDKKIVECLLRIVTEYMKANFSNIVGVYWIELKKATSTKQIIYHSISFTKTNTR